MAHHVTAVPGLRLVASATAFPGDVELDGRGVELSNEGVARMLLGDELGSADLEQPRAWGLERRRWARARRDARPEECLDAADLALAAARKALARASLAPGEIDVLVTATSTPPRISSSLASRLARSLDCSGLALDLRAGGAGALQGLVVAAQQLASGARHALVVGTEVASLYLDSHDLRSAWLYGDGAGAVVLRADPDAGERGLVGATFGSARAAGRAFTVPGALPPTAEALARGEYRFQRPDGAYGRALLELWRTTSRELVARFPRECAELACFAPYAVSRAQLEAALEPLASPRVALIETLARHACLGAAGALVALHELLSSGAWGPGALVASSALGGGVNRAALIWRL